MKTFENYEGLMLWAARSMHTRINAMFGRALGMMTAAGLLATGCLMALSVVAAPASAATLSASTWSSLSGPTFPAISGAAMAYDPHYGLVIFGGGFPIAECPPADKSVNAPAGWCFGTETSIYNGTSIAQVHYAPGWSMPPVESASMEYDPHTGQLILTGGINGESFSNGFPANAKTYIFEGSYWLPIATEHTPGEAAAAWQDGIEGSAMAYDPATQQLVLFGGQDEAQEPKRETWLWTGSDWSLQHTATVMPYLTSPSMAYEPGVGLVLFGGKPWVANSLEHLSNETYVWNGTNWTQLHPATSPPGEFRSAMAYDPAINELVLLVGDTNAAHGDKATWTFNGTSWTEQHPSASPPDLLQANMVDDAGTEQVVLFGGYLYSQVSRSNTVNPTTIAAFGAAPAAPAVTSVTSGNTQLRVAFKAPATDGGSPITSYEVEAVNSVGTGVQIARAQGTGSPLAVTGLTNGDPYYLYVRAKNAVGESYDANYTATATPKPEAPTAPVIQVVTSKEVVTKHGSATVRSWEAVMTLTAPSSDGGSAIESYQVECIAAASGCPDQYYGPYAASSSSVAVPDLTVGESYEFRVRAKNSAGYGSWSSESNLIVIGRAPEAPADITAVSGPGRVSVSFGEPFNYAEPAETFTVVATNERTGVEEAVSGSASPITVSQLVNGEAYELTVYACNVVAESEAGGCPKATIRGVVPGELPGAPQSVSAEAGYGQSEQATVAFNEPSDRGAPVGWYWVEACEVQGGTVNANDCFSELVPAKTARGRNEATVGGLTNGSEYEFRVLGENVIGAGPVSEWSPSVIPGLEPTVVAEGTSELTKSSATLNLSINPNYVAIDRCEVEYEAAGSGETQRATCSDLPAAGHVPVHVTVHLTGLSPNTEYVYRAYAENQDGQGAPSGTTFTTLANSGVGLTINPLEAATASDAGAALTATAAEGTGTVAVGQYEGIPTSLTEQLTFRAGSYFDVFLSEGNSFGKLEFTDCELYGAQTVKWYNPAGLNTGTGRDTGAWQAVSNELYKAGSGNAPACVTVTIDGNTEPSLKQMEGTVFSAAIAAGPAPTITAVSPKKGSSAGGTMVTLTGTGFAGVAGVKFGSVAAKTVIYVSPSSIEVVSPGEAVGTVAIYVTTPNGTNAAGKKDKYKIKAVKIKR